MYSDEIYIVLEDVTLSGRLYVPESPKGLVIIAEGKDCKMLKVVNDYLSRALHKKNIATLFAYLLYPPQEQEYDIPFDIGLMSQHLEKVTKWVSSQPLLQDLSVGYFAVNTAAASALLASNAVGDKVKAIVCDCGRPDLAGPGIALVKPATLLITGAENVYLKELNWHAYSLLTCEKQVVTIDGDSAFFEEAGKARKIAQVSVDWFHHHLSLFPSRHRAKMAAHEK
jgi:putative phosphoribosyl transferase